MGSKQALSNGNEPEELTDLLSAFEKENQVTIALVFGLAVVSGKHVLRARAVATNKHADPVVRARWAFARVVLLAREYTSLMGLVTTLLYKLDFEIGEQEMRAIGIKKA